MGTMRGEARGKTKAEVWRKYQIARGQDGSVFIDHHPANHQEANSKMEKDPKTGEWVLKFIFTM